MRLPRRFKSFILAFLILLPLFAFAREERVRIISLTPSITESLYQLGVEEELIAVTSFCNYPPQAKTKEIIGTIVNPNIEKIYSLSPDLVLATNGINRPGTIAKLKSLGLRVEVFDECKDLSDILTNFTNLAKLVKKSEKAKEVIKEVEIKVESITERVKEASSVRVFWEVGVKPLVSIGPQSFANEFIKYSGGVNIFNDSPVKYPRVSREDVLKKNPDAIVLVVGMGIVREKEMTYWQKFKDLEAVRSNRICVIDADKVCRPTPRGFSRGLEEVAKLIHPELF